MDNSSPYYLLRWSDHITNYAEIFLTLREEEEFVDCSIACDDGVVGAHRIVLAGCSPYLRDLLKRSANPHPIIFLVNVSRSTVLLLLEFIYRGQAHIPYSRLHQLVTLGKSMQVKGLSQIVLPENNPTLMTRSLPIIPRLHGAPDPVAEVMSDITSERDSSNHPSPGNDDMLSSNASEDSGADSVQVGNRQVPETEKAETTHTKQKKNIRERCDNVIDTPKPKKQRQIEKQSHSVQELCGSRISDAKDSVDEAVSSSIVKKRLLDDSVASEDTNRNEERIKKVDQSKLKYVPKPKSKQEKQKRNTIANSEKSSMSPEEETMAEKESLSKENFKRGRPPSSTEAAKGKVAVFKIKKNPPLGRVKKEPKEKLYRSGRGLKLELGAYAIRHGVEMSQRFIFAKYGVKIRRKSLEKMISMCSPLCRKNTGLKRVAPKRNVKN